MKKITEAERRTHALRLIEDLAENAGLRCKNEHDTAVFNEIYSLAHTANNRRCRRNHAAWTEKLDAVIHAKRKEA